MNRESIAVIGSGIGGLCASLELLKRGHSVKTFYDPEQPYGASRCALGLSTTKGTILPRSPLFRAKWYGHYQFEAFCSEVESLSGQKIKRDFKGLWEPCPRPTDYQRIRSRVFHKSFCGLWGAHLKSSRTAWALGDQFQQNPHGFFYWQDGWYNPNDLLRALGAACESLGGEFFAERITRICTPERKTSTSENRPPLKLLGSGFSARAHKVVIAAGAGTKKLLKDLGAQDPLIENEGVILDYPLNVQKTSRRPPFGPAQNIGIVSGTKGALIIGERVRVGAFSLTGLSDRGDLESSRMADLGIAFLTPLGLKDLVKGQPKVSKGIRVRTQDRMPVVGPLSCPALDSDRDVWLMTGLYKSGFQIAPSLAKALGEAIESTDKTLSPYGFPIKKWDRDL
jgi:glycine/D-amino acid oxidase-like deaminating enzyme